MTVEEYDRGKMGVRVSVGISVSNLYCLDGGRKGVCLRGKGERECIRFECICGVAVQ